MSARSTQTLSGGLLSDFTSHPAKTAEARRRRLARRRRACTRRINENRLHLNIRVSEVFYRLGGSRKRVAPQASLPMVLSSGGRPPARACAAAKLGGGGTAPSRSPPLARNQDQYLIDTGGVGRCGGCAEKSCCGQAGGFHLFPCTAYDPLIVCILAYGSNHNHTCMHERGALR